VNDLESRLDSALKAGDRADLVEQLRRDRVAQQAEIPMSNKDRAVQKNAGWRQAMPDMRERAEALIMALDAKGAAQDGDVIRRLLHLLDSRDANVKAEERAAWDEYLAALLPHTDKETAAKQADMALIERRKRFAP